MKTLSRFVIKFTSLIVAVLSCFDRVIFKGYLPITNGPALEGFVDYVLKIRRCDFMAFAEEQSKPWSTMPSDWPKRPAPNTDFFKAITARTSWSMRSCDNGPSSRADRRPLLHGDVAPASSSSTARIVLDWSTHADPSACFYFYFLDPELGQIYVRLTTWFPFTVQVYVNGHSWLEKQMLKRRIGFTLRDNAFTALDDPEAAQKLADSFGHLNWRKILNRLVRQVNPLMKERWFRGYNYYWVVDQAEYATDLIFTSRESLAGLYSRLLDHAAINFSAKDILTFLGRRFHPRFDGEVLTSCQKDRWPGARIKHRMKNNWLKMYDKFGLVLRIETVINNPREFRVRRWRTRAGPPRDGVVSDEQKRDQPVPLPRGRLGRQRTLPGGVVRGRESGAAYRQVEKITEPVVKAGRSYARLQPGEPPGRQAVRGRPGWQPCGARLPKRRHPRGAVRNDRRSRGTSSPKRGGRPFVEAACMCAD